MTARTFRVDRNLVVLEHVRGVRVDRDPYGEPGADFEDSCSTLIWLRDLAHPLSLKGNHLDALQAALEAARTAAATP